MKKWLLMLIACLTVTIAHAQPLPAKEVFQIQVNKVDPNTFTINWQIKPGYFLYSDRIKVTQPADSNTNIAPLRLPPSLTKTDTQGHTYPVYRDQLHLSVGVLGDKSGESLMDVHYQGCSDDGFCYPPEVRQIKLTIDNNRALSDVSLEESSAVIASKPIKSTNKIADIFTNHNWAVILFSFFGFGLLLSFTPCILPMVPVLSGIIVGHGKEVTTSKAFFLSLSYVLSMSLTYAIVGAVVALLGANIQISMQSPWAISVFSIIFVLLALSMFGFYEFKLPNSWQAKIAGSSRSQRGGHYLGAALMGCLSTLILSPCVTAPLLGVLTYIAQTGNVFLGMITLFFLSLGMGTPLLLIGTSAGRWLPESGAWMNAVKGFFGILLLAVAIFLMERIIPATVSMMLWASLLIFSGIYAGALTHSPTNQEKFCQGIGIILLGYGLLILIGASSGSTNPLQPLANLQAANAPITPVQNTRLENINQIKEAIKKAHGKPVMLDFYADWCASCKVMEATTLKDLQVVEALSHFKVLKIDVTAINSDNKEIMAYFNVIAPPAYLFFNADGKPLKNLSLVGESSVQEFLEALNHAK